MNLLIVNHGIPHCISNLPCCNALHFLRHNCFIFLNRDIWHIVDDRSNSLRNRLGRYHDNIFVLRELLCLICCKDNIFIIWKNKDIIRIDFLNGIEHILRTGIHGLSALDDIVNAERAENFIHALSDRNCNKSCFFMHSRRCLLIWHRRRPLVWKLGTLHLPLHHVGHLLITLKTHIFYNDGRECAKTKRLLHRKSGIIGMHMDFYNLIICHNDDGIADGREIFFKIHLLFDIKGFIEHNQKLCTITEFNLCICLCLNGGRHRTFLCGSAGLWREIKRDIHFFAKKCVISSFEHFHKSLPARINHARLL